MTFHLAELGADAIAIVFGFLYYLMDKLCVCAVSAQVERRVPRGYLQPPTEEEYNVSRGGELIGDSE